MSVAYILTPTSITVALSNGRTYTVPKTSAQFETLKTALREKRSETEIEKILNIKAYIAQVTEGRAEIVDGRLYFDGSPLHGVLAERVAVMFAEGFGVAPLLRFLNRVALNPRKDIADELYPFLESGSCPITEEGFIIAYKIVREDFYDIYTGKMDNSPGQLVSLESFKDAEYDRRVTCARGLHFASLQYIESGAYGGNFNGNRLVQVLIDPADIVSIPTDYNCSKGRAWKYTILREIDWSDRIKDYFVSTEYVDNIDNDDGEKEEIWDEQDDDIADAIESTAAPLPASTKLTEKEVREILVLLDEETHSLSAIAALYNISARQVARIRDGEAWAWVQI